MSQNNNLPHSIADDFSKEQMDVFCAVMQVPDFMIAWLSRFFETREIAFVLELNRQRSADMGVQNLSEWIQKK